MADADDVTPDDAAPDDATPVAATPDDATQEFATTEAAAPDDVTPDDATPEAATPDAATPEAASPDDVTREYATRDDVARGDAPTTIRQPRPAPPYAAPPSAAAVNPFAGVPGWDYVRDAVAAILLLVSLGLRWDDGNDATGRVDVVLVTVLSVFSLAAAYLVRLGALGAGWGPARIRQARLALNAPYLGMVAVYVLFDLVRGGDRWLAMGGAAEGGVGAALGVGLAGALLAAQPREAETGERTGAVWRWVTAGIGAVIACGAVGGLVATLVRTADGIWFTTVLWAILLTLITLVLVVGPIVGTVLRSAPWRLVLLALGGGALVLLALTDGSGGFGGDVETLHGLGFGYVLWPAAAAAAATPGVRQVMTDHGRRARWIGAAVQLLTLVAVAGALQAALLVVRLTDSIDEGQGTEITSLVLVGLYAVAALVARSALAQNQPYGRPVAFVVAAALLLIGLVNLAVIAASDDVSAVHLDRLFALVVPLALAVMVVAAPAGDASRRAGSRGPTTSLPKPAGPAA